MSVYYDLYASGNPQKKDEQQPLHARVIPSGTLDAKKFIAVSYTHLTLPTIA